MIEILKQVIVSQQQRVHQKPLFQRNLVIPATSERIITITGARRTGKTSHQKLMMRQLLSEGVSADRIVYLNLEDDRLFPGSLEQLGLLPDAYYSLFPDNRNQKVWFFLDEVQEVTGWETFVRRLQDTENCSIVLTGSSSKLLSRELATELRGRSLNYEVFPYSLVELVSHASSSTFNPYSDLDRARVCNVLDQYLAEGGFPEIVGVAIDDKRRIWQEYVDLMIYRDMIERHNVGNTFLLRYFLKFLILNQGNLLSVNKVYQDFKSLGHNIGRASLYDYLSYAEDAYVIFPVHKFSENIREQQRNPMKIYLVDSGLKQAMTTKMDRGRSMENAVYLKLRQMEGVITYWKGKQEVDFCIQRRDGIHLINVCDDINDPTTRKRELSGLNEAMRYFGINQSLLITSNLEESARVENGLVEIKSAWKWLMDD